MSSIRVRDDRVSGVGDEVRNEVGDILKLGEERGLVARKGESLGNKSESLEEGGRKEKEGERMNKVDNLKTKNKRQHSDTFILKNTKTDTKTVRELVDRYEGWGKESGTSGTAKEPFKFGQTVEDNWEESPMKRRRMAPGLLETRGTSPLSPSPGPASKKKVSSYKSSSTSRTLPTPSKGTGPRRLKTGLATQTTATTSPHTTPWMVSRWPGSLGTLASTVPLSTSSTRGQ